MRDAMGMRALCHICMKVADSVCVLCGKPVCNEHMGKDMVCKSCIAGRRGRI